MSERSRYRLTLVLVAVAWAIGLAVLIFLVVRHRRVEGLPGALGTMAAALTAGFVAYVTAITTNRRQREQFENERLVAGRADFQEVLADAVSALVLARDALQKGDFHEAARKKLETAGGALTVRFAIDDDVSIAWSAAYKTAWAGLAGRLQLTMSEWKDHELWVESDDFIEAARANLATAK